jgi:hypothetical protein
VWTRLMWLRIGPVAECREESNEISCTIKGGEYLD